MRGKDYDPFTIRIMGSIAIWGSAKSAKSDEEYLAKVELGRRFVTAFAKRGKGWHRVLRQIESEAAGLGEF